jgi:phosphate-selective porin OprO and OprP
MATIYRLAFVVALAMTSSSFAQTSFVVQEPVEQPTLIPTAQPPRSSSSSSQSREQITKQVEPKKEEPKKDDAKSDSTKKEDQKPAAEKKSEDPELTAKWHHGLELTSKKKDFRVHVGGRFQFDVVGYDAPDSLQTGPGGVGLLQDGADFRRARIRIDGTMYDTFDWAAEFDFVNGAVGANTPSINTPAPTDLYVEFTKIPTVGALRVGNTKEPFSFEHLTSSRYLHFLERSPNFDPFAERFHNGFTPGFLLHNTYDDERGTWWLGLFHDTNTPFGFGVGDQNWVYDARVTYLPIWDECNHTLLHVGVAYSHRNLVGDRVRLRSRPSLRSGPGPLTPVLADTGTVASTIEDLAGLELVAVSGPWTWQSECFASWVQDARTIPAGGGIGAPLGSLFFSGWYTEVLYFLTGESREYNRKSASFDRVKPCRNLRWAKDDCECDDTDRHAGAWQVGIRYSQTDLLDGGVGAVLEDWTLGLNWYMSPNVKVQWNYVATHRRAYQAEGWIHGIGGRLAIDF